MVFLHPPVLGDPLMSRFPCLQAPPQPHIEKFSFACHVSRVTMANAGSVMISLVVAPRSGRGAGVADLLARASVLSRVGANIEAV